MARDAHYVAVYDISSDAERERVARVLEGFGFRVQASVFECRLNARMKEELLAALDSLRLESGTVLIYRLPSPPRRIAIGIHADEPMADARPCFIA